MGTREVDGILIFDLSEGRLVFGERLTNLQEAVEGEMFQGKVRQILNLKQVNFIDSSALGLLVMLHTGMAKAGGELKLLHLSERHLELLVLTKLNGVFEIFDDEQDAINSFYPERQVKHFDILEFVKNQENEPEVENQVADPDSK